MSKVTKNYNKDYFNWYKNIGEFGAIMNHEKFQQHISYNDSVLDFGCGGGYLLEKIKCRIKEGVDINPEAIKESKKRISKVYENSNQLPEEYYDKIISHSTLQHCEYPLSELINLHKSLKKDGVIILITSCSSRNLKFKPNDINYQLYSWSPMNLGNILDSVGFKVIKVNKINHRWIPKYNFFYKLLGKKIFNSLCFFYSFFDSSITNVISIAKKV